MLSRRHATGRYVGLVGLTNLVDDDRRDAAGNETDRCTLDASPTEWRHAADDMHTIGTGRGCGWIASRWGVMTGSPGRHIHLHFVTDDDAPLSDLYVEAVADEEWNGGIVVREVGLDRAGNVVHRMPSPNHRWGYLGIFDGTVIRVAQEDETSDISIDEFETLWGLPDLHPPPTTYGRATNWRSRIHREFRDRPAAHLHRSRPDPSTD